MLFLTQSVLLCAQSDTLVLRNGEKIGVQVKRVTTSEIGYVNPTYGADIDFTIPRGKVYQIRFENGSILPISKIKGSQRDSVDVTKRRAIKINLLHPVAGLSGELSYEVYRAPGLSTEFTYSFQPRNGGNPYAFQAIRFGTKFFADYKFPFNRYTNYLLRGVYLKPEVMLVRASLDPVHRRGEERNDPILYTGGLIGTIGQQLVFRNGIVVDYYFSYGIGKSEEREEPSSHKNIGGLGFVGFHGYDSPFESINKPFTFFGLGIRLGYNF